MSLHLGLHWNMMIVIARKQMRLAPSKTRTAAEFGVSALIAAYGVYVFISRRFPTYLFLKSEFVFMDYNESKLLFYFDYLALMGLCIFISHYGSKLFRKAKESKE